jgi:hypothetical protein
MMSWREAVISALERYSKRNQTHLIRRQLLIEQELKQIIQDTNSIGITPSQTMSRILQELGQSGLITLKGDGVYLLLSETIDIEKEDLPEEAIDIALRENKLRLGVVPTDDLIAVTRRRKGQQRIRRLSLENYRNRCGFCDIQDRSLLVAAHIVRWADRPEQRGNLHNVICMCRFHDTLFEHGYIAMKNDYSIIKRSSTKSSFLDYLLLQTTHFYSPLDFQPLPEFLETHRNRVGL